MPGGVENHKTPSEMSKWELIISTIASIFLGVFILIYFLMNQDSFNLISVKSLILFGTVALSFFVGYTCLREFKRRKF